MAEVALAAFSGLGTVASAAAPALSTTLGVLQGVATVGSVIMGVMAGQQERVAGQAAATDATLQADTARLDGERQATESAARAVEIQKDHLRKIGAARVAFAGSGLDISSGQLASIEAELGHQADYGLTLEAGNQAIARANAGLREGQYRNQADVAESSAKVRERSRYLGAGVDAAKGLLSLYKRG